MAWRIERDDANNRQIVLDGFEQGIAASPYAGIADLRNVDITSVPGQASVSFEGQAFNTPPTVSEEAFTTSAASNIFTVSDTSSYYDGMAIEFDSIVTTTGISTGRVYWMNVLNSTQFRVHPSPSIVTSTQVSLTNDGSGTFSTYTLGKPIDDAVAFDAQGQGEDAYYFILDDNGLAWWVGSALSGVDSDLSLIYMGNDTTTGGSGRAITVYKGHLLVFRSANIDGVGIAAMINDQDFDTAYTNASTGGWEYGWQSVTAVTLSQSGGEPRPVLVGQDDTIYFANGQNSVGSIVETSGDTFELDDSSSWVANTAALDIPENDEIQSLAELGLNLLVGGVQNKIYPWDRISSSFSQPILVPERTVKKMISTNERTFIFAGTKGNIYETNGASVGTFFTMPNHLAGVNKPHFKIQATDVDENNLYFSYQVLENDGSTAVAGMDTVWAIDLDTKALRGVQSPTHGTDGLISVIRKNKVDPLAQGEGLFVGWTDASTNYGLDLGSSNPYDGGESVIDFDAIPLADANFSKNPTQFEVSLTQTLVSGESLELLGRKEITGSYTSIGTMTSADGVKKTMNTTLEDCLWIQLQAILTSTDTSPTFVPLRKVLIQFV